MSITKSPNCKRYTDTISALVQATSSVPGSEKCVVHTPAFSCQTNAFEQPDLQTAEFLKSSAIDKLKKMECDITNVEHVFSTNLMGARELEYSAEKLANGGMASNCFVWGNDSNLSTHKIVARCNPMYDMKDSKGNTVRNYNMSFNSDLLACDVSDEAMPQLLEDARKVAAYNAGVNGYIVDKPEHLACNFSILPSV